MERIEAEGCCNNPDEICGRHQDDKLQQKWQKEFRFRIHLEGRANRKKLYMAQRGFVRALGRVEMARGKGGFQIWIRSSSMEMSSLR